MKNITPYSDTIVYNTISIYNINININDIDNYAKIDVMLYSDNNQKILSCNATKLEMDSWGEDDSYILNFVANKFGITLE